MKCPKSLAGAATAALALFACDKGFDDVLQASPSGTVQLAARLAAASAQDSALLRLTDSVIVSLDTGSAGALRNVFLDTVAYAAGGVALPALPIGTSYALSYRGMAGAQPLWSGSVTGAAAKESRPVLTVSATATESLRPLRVDTVAVPSTDSVEVTLTPGNDGSIRDVMSYSIDGGASWKPYGKPFRVLRSTSVRAKDSIAGLDLAAPAPVVVPGPVEVAPHELTLSLLSGTGRFDKPFSSGLQIYNDTVAAGAVTETLTANATDTSGGTTVTGAGTITLAGDKTDVDVTVSCAGKEMVYTVHIIREGAVVKVRPDSSLSLLGVGKDSRMSPSSLRKGVFSYVDSVAWDAATEIIYATARTTGAAITFNGSKSSEVTLTGAVTKVDVKVEAISGTDTAVAVYTVSVVRRPRPHDTTLSKLEPAKGALDPGFYSGTTGYDDNVPASTTSESLTVTALDDSAKVSCRGCGNSSSPFVVDLGAAGAAASKTVTFTVTNGSSTQDYTVRVVRPVTTVYDATLKLLSAGSGTLSPKFASGTTTTSFDDSVSAGATSETITATASAGTSAKVECTGCSNTASPFTVDLGAAGTAVAKTVTITVINGTVSKAYKVKVTRPAVAVTDAKLSTLVVSNGKLEYAFDPAFPDYTDRVNAAVTGEIINVTAAAGTSAQVACTGCSNAASPFTVDLGAAGTAVAKTVTITVTNGTSKMEYKVQVVRPAPVPHDTTLKSLVPTVGTLSPDFKPGIQEYTLDLPYDTNIVSFKAAPTDANATVPPVTIADLSLKRDGDSSVAAIKVEYSGATLTYRVTVRRATIPWNKSVGAWGTVADGGGRTYQTVSIGNQTWMAENLNYRGTGAAPLGTCPHYSVADSCDGYGRLYSWAEALGLDTINNSKNYGDGDMARGICPMGWHVPNYAEWQTLYDYAQIVADNKGIGTGTALKSQKGWTSNGNVSGNGTDAIGFRALPTGWMNGTYLLASGNSASWVSATQEPAAPAIDQRSVLLKNDESSVWMRADNSKSFRFPLRCIKD